MMNIIERHISIALVIAVVLVTANIVAVVSGDADTFYYRLEQLLR